MRIFIGLFAAAALWGFQAAAPPAPVSIRSLNQASLVLGQNRAVQVFLPSGYDTSKKRYPVIYWFHGYEPPNEERERELTAYLGAHDLIVVNIGPVETIGNFPLYFPELTDFIDKTLRTVADREHRAVTGYSTGGFMALWTAGKFPDMISSASSFMGLPEASIGPQGFDVQWRLSEQYANYDGVRTRLVAEARDAIRYYHRQINAIWLFARLNHETEDFDREQATTAIPKTFDFHMKAFANPLPKPALFNHTDAYPNFAVWGWDVTSDRRQPGVTMLENVSKTGFRSSVREWSPAGSPMPAVKLSLVSPRLYAPGSSQTITYLRLRDGNLRKAVEKADAKGQLTFELDGEPTEVGIAAEALIGISGYELQDGVWPTADKPFKLKVRFVNKGANRSLALPLQWETPNPGVKLDVAAKSLFGLAPGESMTIPVTVTVSDPQRQIVRLVAVQGVNRMPIEVPLYQPAEPAKEFQIADGRSLDTWLHATEHTEMTFGDGNHDSHAAPGESFAILIPDGGALRVTEVFTQDSCVDIGMRAGDSWDNVDHAAATIPYSIPAIRQDCEPGHIVKMLTRYVTPDYQSHYFTVEFPVWYRPGTEPK